MCRDQTKQRKPNKSKLKMKCYEKSESYDIMFKYELAGMERSKYKKNDEYIHK